MGRERIAAALLAAVARLGECWGRAAEEWRLARERGRQSAWVARRSRVREDSRHHGACFGCAGPLHDPGCPEVLAVQRSTRGDGAHDRRGPVPGGG